MLCSAQSFEPSTLLCSSTSAHMSCSHPGCNHKYLRDSQMVFRFPVLVMGGESPEKSHFQRLFFLSASPMWDLTRQIPNCLNSRFQVQPVTFESQHLSLLFLERAGLSLEFLSTECGRNLGHLVTYTSKKRQENAPGNDTILLTTQGTKKHPDLPASPIQ